MEERIAVMLPLLNEKQRRIFLANEAIAYGYGGIAKAAQFSGASRNTIKQGIAEIESGKIDNDRVRKVCEILKPN